jgi:alkylation response protein AidB-like acyl-CoA dehydrogenase
VVGTISSAAWALGVAERALHEIAEIAKAGRTRMGSLPLREQPTFQRDFGVHKTAVQAARLLTKQAYSDAVAAVGGVPEVLEERLRDTKAAASYATKVAKAAVGFAYEASGSAGMRNPNRLQRSFRDICVGASATSVSARPTRCSTIATTTRSRSPSSTSCPTRSRG